MSRQAAPSREGREPGGAEGGLERPVTALRGVGPVTAEALAASGVHTLEDLLFHLPRRYEDRTTVSRLAEVRAPGRYTVAGRLVALRRLRTRRRGVLVRGTVQDGSGSLAVLWFNRPYLADQVRPRQHYLLHGLVRWRGTGLELVNPSCEPRETAVHAGQVVPVYPSLGKIGGVRLRRLIGQLVERADPAHRLQEPLPRALLGRYGLPPLGEALVALHRPDPEAPVERLNERRTPAHCRLRYGELLELQLALAGKRARRCALDKPHRYRFAPGLRQDLERLAPFSLTAAQKRVLGEILEDLARRAPMCRLLQGDVGSGKTVVAVLALAAALRSGLQGAFMAPTELLAEQHYRSVRRLLGGEHRTVLLTRSTEAAPAVCRELERGAIELVVGTHALIQENVRFRRLGLAVIDEQHRFGVLQRERLRGKGQAPDLLLMTATPIPRSLALTVYGDLDTSLLDEGPPGRQPVTTEVVPARERPRVYRELAAELAAGGQAYVVFPVIDAGSGVAAEALGERGERVRGLLQAWPSGVLHGRMAQSEREAVMGAFATGSLRLLVATTVIEVGVDVPGATRMVIESAERFGLAQLHQLRGRVARSRRPARCVAVHGETTPEAATRLEVFRSTLDGFRLAEADLEIRGPGELLGTRQAGPALRNLADLLADRVWLERARRDAGELLPQLGATELAALRRRVRRRWGSELVDAP